MGLEHFHAGRFKESLALMKRACDEYDPVAHRDLAFRFGHDAWASSANYQAWNLWHLGFPDQASRRADEAVQYAHALGHANTTGLVLCYGANYMRIWLRQPQRVESHAREALRLAEDNGMELWHPVALVQLGWALSQRGTAPGLDEIETGLRAPSLMGAGRIEIFHLSVAAEAYARAGQHDEARRRMERAFSLLSRGNDDSCAAEFHRIRAGLLRGGNAEERGAAEADLRRAIEIARGQAALSLELRAARDLGSMLSERGERRQATDLLAPVYARFTEGFDTADLLETKALLEALRA
jgi:tetratricopeptide (TPR) repeat protein